MVRSLEARLAALKEPFWLEFLTSVLFGVWIIVKTLLCSVPFIVMELIVPNSFYVVAAILCVLMLLYMLGEAYRKTKV